MDGRMGRQTDGLDGANGCFLQFCEHAEKGLLSKGKQTNHVF
jgi:hypothetical protein